ncbi:MAG: hypothetical protein J3R72DRAFT_490742 [Linnemannia gamsii]|nr:MAG: hypothetical protein J3R72DRAFT_490742 [Linnemannia gamsii]
MSAFDPSDPYDNDQPWQNVASTQPVWPTLVDHVQATHHSSTSTSTSVSAAVQPVSAPPAVAPTPAPAPTDSSSTTHTIADAVSSLFHRHPQETHAPTPAPVLSAGAGAGSSSTSTSTPVVPQAQAPAQKAKKAMLAEGDHPPSYESSVVTNIPQIHDNYDHLRGPPGQRGLDIKTRIPLDSTPAEHFQGGGAAAAGGSGSNAGGSGSQRQYGATSQSAAPPANSSSSTSSKTTAATATTTTRLQGQTSHGRNDDEAQHSRDVDRLLGPNSNTEQDEEDEEPKTHWSIVGDRKAWTAFFYIIFILIPLSLVFFVWSMATLIISAVSMIFPPVGYFVVIATVTSWRALGRLDLFLSRALVPKDVRERHPYLTFDIFVKPGTEECAHHGIHASASSSSTTPPASSEETYTTAEGEVRQRRKKPRNVFDKSASHLSASFSNKHTLKTLSYLMIWKLVLAVPAFVIVAVVALLTIPLIFCLLPSMLIISRFVVHLQFRWAVMWLAEKSKPIALA